MLLRSVLACGLYLLGAIGTCMGQSDSAASSEPSSTASSNVDARGEALRWLDRLAIEQVLFNPEDVQSWRDAVDGMTPAQAADWWQQHAVQRQLLDDPNWQSTRQWWREFLKVQAIYSDQEIQARRADAFVRANRSARELSDVMQELSDERQALAAGSQRSASTRRLLIDLNTEYKQEQQRQRALSLQARPMPVVIPAPPIVVRDRGASYRRPLITSRDAARWSILGNFLHGW